MSKLVAYHNDPSEKTAILAQLEAHRLADELIKGHYWQDGKGCAIGCTLHSADHAEYEPRFGIPQMLAHLEDCVFEGLPNGVAKAWPSRFMSAIEPGSDLSTVGWKFLHWLLTDETINTGINHPLVKNAIRQCADVLAPLTKGLLADENAAWNAARSAASAASAAKSAAKSAAWNAESAAWSVESAAKSAESAAWSVESAAWSAAWSAARSVESAAWSAESAAWSVESAASVVRSAAYVKMADELIALLKAAP